MRRLALAAALILPLGIAVSGITFSAASSEAAVPAPTAVASGPVRANVVTQSLGAIDPAALSASPSATTAVPVAGSGDGAAPRQAPGRSLRAAAVTQPQEVAPFGLVGITAARPFDPASRILLRVRSDGRWQDWMEVPINDDRPDPDSPEGRQARFSSIPVAAPRSDGIQVRIDTPTGTLPRDTKLTMVDNAVRPQDATLGSQPQSRAAVGQPPIITRAQWGADESLRTGTTTYSSSGTIKVAFIHHVVSSNDYSPAEAAAEMRNIYSWFTTGIGCYDFGYNFMIDRYGRLYEGRAGSIDKPVVGAHTSGFNDQTFAVSFLGNSDTLNPTKAEGDKILSSIARLIAWKFSIYKVNPYGTAVLTSAGPGPGGGTTSMYYKGEQVSVYTVSGHGDVGSTACPGAWLHPEVVPMRDRVAAILGGTALNPHIKGSGADWGSGDDISVIAKTKAAVDAQVEVTSACGDRVRTVRGSVGSAGELVVSWDGRDASGARVPPGHYTLTLTGRSEGEDIFPWTGEARIAKTADSPPDPCTPPNKFVIEGNGYGHGVGLSQWGAYEMAKEGHSAADIIEHYYPGTSVSAYADDVQARISLLYQAESAHVRVEDLGSSGAQVEVKVGATVVKAGPETNFTFTPNGRYVSVRKIVGTKESRVGRAERVEIRWSGTRDPGSAGTAPALLNVAGPGEAFSSDGHRYRYGTVDIGSVKTSDGVRLGVVNAVRLHDEYLYGIAEVVPSWPSDALQSQVIASRSYALATMAGGIRADCRCHMDDGDGPYYDQTFKGYVVESGPSGANWKRAVDATLTDATHGETAVYNGRPITAFYTAATGGRTSSASDVWGGQGYPWSVSVDDHYSLRATANPYNDWKSTVSQDDMAAAFGSSAVMAVKVSRLLDSGAAKQVTATLYGGREVTISASAFRSALGLRSTYFVRIGDEKVDTPTDPTDPAPTNSVTLNASHTGSVPVGTVVTLSGKVKDVKPGLVVQRQVRWTTADWQDRDRATPAADGSFSFTVTATPVGMTYTWRVVVLSGTTIVATSPERTVTVV